MSGAPRITARMVLFDGTSGNASTYTSESFLVADFTIRGRLDGIAHHLEHGNDHYAPRQVHNRLRSALDTRSPLQSRLAW
jgi:hypothetical protein